MRKSLSGPSLEPFAPRAAGENLKACAPEEFEGVILHIFLGKISFFGCQSEKCASSGNSTLGDRPARPPRAGPENDRTRFILIPSSADQMRQKVYPRAELFFWRPQLSHGVRRWDVFEVFQSELSLGQVEATMKWSFATKN